MWYYMAWVCWVLPEQPEISSFSGRLHQLDMLVLDGDPAIGLKARQRATDGFQLQPPGKSRFLRGSCAG